MLRKLKARWRAMKHTATPSTKRKVWRQVVGQDPPPELYERWKRENIEEIERNITVFLEGAEGREIDHLYTKYLMYQQNLYMNNTARDSLYEGADRRREAPSVEESRSWHEHIEFMREHGKDLELGDAHP